MRSLDREILRLAAPALGALAADPLVSLVDTAWVGRIDAQALAALGVAAAIFGIILFLFNFLAYGSTPLVAEAFGRSDFGEAARLGSTAFRLAAGVGIVVGLALAAGAPAAVGAVGARGDVADAAVRYLRIRALAAPGMLLIVAGHGVFRGFQDTKTPLGVTIGFNLVNLVLDPLLIFGFGWGIAGAAWATVVAQGLGAAAFMVVARRRLPVAGPSWAAARRLLGVGQALVLRTAALLATYTLATAVATRMGEVTVAAHQVASQLWVFLALAVDAVAIAGQALVARYLGSGEPGEARRAMVRLLWWGAAGGLILAAVMAILSPVLPSLFSSDAEVRRAVALVYPFVVLLQPLSAVVYVWDGVVMGAADFGFLVVAMVISTVAACVIIVAALPAGWGLQGVWWGVTALIAMRAVTMVWWQQSARSPRPA